MVHGHIILGEEREKEGREVRLEIRDLPSNTNCKSSIVPISALSKRHLPTKIATGAVEDLVTVAMFNRGDAIVGMAMNAVVGMWVRHF